MLLDRIKSNLENEQDRICYYSKSKQYTFLELYVMVKQIYKYIIENKIESRVVCFGHKEVEMLATFLACSFAGITYIPVDSSFPEERLKYIVKDLDAKYIFNYSAKEIDFVKCVIGKEEQEKIFNTDVLDLKLNILMKPADTYYIIYTSGSTGNPKGVEITYANLDSFVSWFVKVINNEKTRVLNQALFSFDLSVADIYFSLYTASTLCITESNGIFNAKELYKELRESKAEVAVMTPSYADVLLSDKSFNSELMPNLSTIYFCGEILNKKTVDKLKLNFGKVRIINSYGPTECTVAISAIDVENLDEPKLPVGVIKDDTNVIILDENGNSTNGVGEIVITGKSVGKGYLNISSQSFFVYNGSLAYRTGDLGYMEKEILYFEGRKDNQIKYLGHRIELDDINNNILTVDKVENAVTFAKKNKENVTTRLISLVKLKEGKTATVSEINNALKDKLPNYMMPKIKVIDKIILTPNGKIDKKQIEELYNERQNTKDCI